MKILKKFEFFSLLSIASLLLALFLSFSLVRNIISFTQANERLIEEEEKIAVLEKEVKELEKRVQSVRTQEFVEKQARDKLGLAQPGEVVLVLPEDEVLAKLAPEIATESDFLPKANWQKWLEIFK